MELIQANLVKFKKKTDEVSKKMKYKQILRRKFQENYKKMLNKL